MNSGSKILYDKSKIDFKNLLFTNKALKALIIPLILEQLLNAMMGMADTLMVSRVSDAAISAVSSADMINFFIIQIFTAFAASAVIICSQYAGRNDRTSCNNAAKQVVLTLLCISVLFSVICTVFCNPILRLFFGSFEKEVMDNARSYFFITALSFPFIALFSAGSAFFRVSGNTRFPTIIALISNIVNIVLNYVLIFVCNMGVTGAAIATLFSRFLSMLIVFIRLRRPKQLIVLDRFSTKPNFTIIKSILALGVPTAITNGMFQLGKLVIQSSIATLSTMEMAAHAMAITLETLTYTVGYSVGIALMTISGKALGAGRLEEAKYYTIKLTFISAIGNLAACVLSVIVAPLVARIGGMGPESTDIFIKLNLAQAIMKSLVWALAFTPSNTLQAAGDVKYVMIISSLIMWIVRVGSCFLMINVLKIGIWGAWISLFADWVIRATFFVLRYFSGKWTLHKVI